MPQLSNYSTKMSHASFSIFLFSFLLFANIQIRTNAEHLQSSMVMQTAMPTVTVRGFLNFRTTVDGTVIVFTPSPSQSQTANKAIREEIAPTTPPRITPQEIRPTKVANQGPVQSYPTGLVTVLGGTVVQGGATTVYETKVIGTYISGKYAQILSSTTKVNSEPVVASPTIRPTMSYLHAKVWPTRAVHHGRHSEPNPFSKPKVTLNDDSAKLEDEPIVNAITSPKKVHPLRAKANKVIESSKARHLESRHARFQLNPLKSRWAKPKKEENKDESEVTEVTENQALAKIRKARIERRYLLPNRQSPRAKMNRFKNKLPPTQAEDMQQYYNSKAKEESLEKATQKLIDDKTREKILENLTSTIDSTDKESVEEESQEKSSSEQIDPSKVIKEVQTITSEVTQHVEGNHLQVKTHTTTTTIERPLHPSESEFDTNMVKPTIDISVNDLEATSIPETPALVISRTYSVTERTMRTTVVPVFDGTSTQSHTVTESFFIRKLITAYRTLPPGDVFLIDSTSTMNGNPGLNTEMVNMSDIADLSMAEQGIQASSVEGTIQPTQMLSFPNDIQTSVSPAGFQAPVMPSIGMSLPQMQPNQLMPNFDLNNPLLFAAVLQNPQLAAVYLGLQQMKQQQQSPQFNTITKPTQIMQTETIYNTKVVSFYDGQSTRSRTIIEPSGTTEKIFNTFVTEVVPVTNNFAMQQAQMQNMFANQMGIQPQFQFTPALQTSTVLKTVTTVIDSTMTKSKVYTLVYNAFSTRYRTITSISVTPTTVTTVLTETITVQPTSSPMNMFG